MAIEHHSLTVQPGTAFGPYSVFERLGIGGMASVHRAVEMLTDGSQRTVALKRLLPHLAEDEDFVRAFVREARLASMLDHPNIVTIHELGRVMTDYFISMEYVEGRDVRQALKQARRVAGPPPVGVIVSMLTVLCRALHYAHHKTDPRGRPLELVHRDISPANILISNTGVIKIIDFGIAKATIDQLRTRTGRIKGKLAYMAPEALSGKVPDARSDLWSVGVIAHELACARPLFAAKNDFQTIQRVRRAVVEPPSQKNPTCPVELDAIILKALERKPERRWQSAGEMADALDELARKYHLRPSNQQIAQWCEWAFSLTSTPSTRRATTSVPVTSSIEEALEAVIHSGADESLVEEIWGSGERAGSPVLLPEVPDVSHRKGSTTSGEIRATTQPLELQHKGPPEPEPTVTIADSGPTVTDVDLDEDDVATNIRDASGVNLVPDRIATVVEGRSMAPVVAVGSDDEAAPTETLRDGIAASDRTRAPTRALRRPTARATVPPPPPGEPRITFRHRSDSQSPAVEPVRSGFVAKTSPGVPIVIDHSASAPHTAPTVTLPIAPPSISAEPSPYAYGAFLPEALGTEKPGRTPLPLPDNWAIGTTPPPFDLQSSQELALPLEPDRHRMQWSSLHWLLLAVAVVAVVAIAFVAANLAGNDAPGPAVVHIKTDPADAHIEIEGTLSENPARLEAGSYSLRVSHDDFQTYETVLEVEAGVDQRVQVALSARPQVASTEGEPAHDPAPAHTASVVQPRAVSGELMRRLKGGSPLAVKDARLARDRIRVLVCIDPQGTVTSASVISDVPQKLHAGIIEVLKTWSYEPHLVDGVATPVCFESYPKVRKDHP